MQNNKLGKNKTARISILLEDDLYVQFNNICDKNGFNKSKLIRNFITSIIDGNERSEQSTSKVSFNK